MKNATYIITSSFILIVGLIIGIPNTISIIWDSKIDTSFFKMITSFYSLGLSSLCAASLISYLLLVPKNIDFSFFTLEIEEQFEILKEELGQKRAKSIKLVKMALFVAFPVLFLILLHYTTQFWEHYQFTHYGKRILVEIPEPYKSQKGFDIVNIEYKCNGRYYEKEFYLENYNPKDKEEIIVSAENPMIAEWYDEWIKEK